MKCNSAEDSRIHPGIYVGEAGRFSDILGGVRPKFQGEERGKFSDFVIDFSGK